MIAGQSIDTICRHHQTEFIGENSPAYHTQTGIVQGIDKIPVSFRAGFETYTGEAAALYPCRGF